MSMTAWRAKFPRKNTLPGQKSVDMRTQPGSNGTPSKGGKYPQIVTIGENYWILCLKRASPLL